MKICEVSEMVNFLDLPWEDVICRRILNCLSVKEICSLQFVSKPFVVLVETYFRVCRQIDFSSCGRQANFTAKNFETLASQCESLRTLNLNGCKRWLHDKLLIPVLQTNACLNKIDLTGCLDLTDSVMKVLALNCKFIKELILAECCWLTSHGLLVVGLECSNLSLLILRSCWNVDNESLSTVVKNNKSLVYIDIASCYSINGNTVSLMAKNCNNLKHINIRGCWRVGDDAVFNIKEYCKHLQTLMVNDCRDITEKSLAPLRQVGVNIDVLKPPEYQRPIFPIDYVEKRHFREAFLNLQV